jgi:hypothetical protein
MSYMECSMSGNSEVERLEMLVVEKAQSLLILKVFN